MSRIGQKPIPIPKDVNVSVEGSKVIAKNSKGELSVEFKECVKVVIEEKDGEKILRVIRNDDSRNTKMFQGLYRSLINNMIIGLTQGFRKELHIVGVGYRAQVSGNKISLQVGHTHPVEFEAPPGVKVETPQPTQIVITGIDKQAVGQFAANIRRVRPPEPYKGKGIRYHDEVVRRKVGKAAVGGQA